MPEATFYPDAHPEDTSVDGDAFHQWATISWANLIAGAGTHFESESDNTSISIYSGDYIPHNLGEWETLRRPIILFDTSSLPDDATIASAVLSLYGYAKSDNKGWAPDINIYASAPASETELAAGDYDSLGSTPFCDDPITYAGWLTSGYNNFILNAAGLAAISKAGITKFGVRNANYDVAAVEPTWADGGTAELNFYTAEKGTVYRPKLVVVYNASSYPTDALTRVTGLIHRYIAGSYTLEMALGEVTTDLEEEKLIKEPLGKLVKEGMGKKMKGYAFKMIKESLRKKRIKESLEGKAEKEGFGKRT